MRILADENCDRPTVIALRAAGHDVAYVAEWLGRFDDIAVFAAAHAEKRTLMTSDHDFGLLAERAVERPPAVILTRLERLSSAARCALLVELIASIAPDDLTGRIFVIEPGHVRNRAFKAFLP